MGKEIVYKKQHDHNYEVFIAGNYTLQEFIEEVANQHPKGLMAPYQIYINNGDYAGEGRCADNFNYNKEPSGEISFSYKLSDQILNMRVCQAQAYKEGDEMNTVFYLIKNQ